MKYLLFFFALTYSAVSFAQKDTTRIRDTRIGEGVPVIGEGPIVNQPAIFSVVEQMPEFPGGEAAMMKFIQKNIQYPSMERDNDIQGRVIIKFIVNEDGSLSDIHIARGVSQGLDKEALRVVKLLPKFIPGKQQGKPVKVYFLLPIKFMLVSEPVKKK
jgi:protein TonB